MYATIEEVSSAAAKEISQIVKLAKELIRIDHAVKSELDKRKIRNICESLRELYFSPQGVIKPLQEALDAPLTFHQGELYDKLHEAEKAIIASRATVAKALSELQNLKVDDNFEVDLHVYSFIWKVSHGKGKFGERMGSVITYIANDLDQYGNDPGAIKAHIQLFVNEIHSLNDEISELEKQLKSLLK